MEINMEVPQGIKYDSAMPVLAINPKKCKSHIIDTPAHQCLLKHYL
jgi:hypothetical protein